MHALYLFSVFAHILAATAWIGGMFFLVLVVVPWLRGSAAGRVNGGVFLRETGERFRTVGWVCFGVLLCTGSFNLWVRGVRWASFFDASWRASAFGQSVLLKLGLFVLVLIVSAVHDFSIGPRASLEIARDPGSAAAERLRKAASRWGRLNALLALCIVAVAITLVRGWP
jgi:putative copper export protein